jgi:hypothetical protein
MSAAAAQRGGFEFPSTPAAPSERNFKSEAIPDSYTSQCPVDSEVRIRIGRKGERTSQSGHRSTFDSEARQRPCRDMRISESGVLWASHDPTGESTRDRRVTPGGAASRPPTGWETNNLGTFGFPPSRRRESGPRSGRNPIRSPGVEKHYGRGRRAARRPQGRGRARIVRKVTRLAAAAARFWRRCPIAVGRSMRVVTRTGHV